MKDNTVGLDKRSNPVDIAELPELLPAEAAGSPGGQCTGQRNRGSGSWPATDDGAAGGRADNDLTIDRED